MVLEWPWAGMYRSQCDEVWRDENEANGTFGNICERHFQTNRKKPTAKKEI
jgi:hypothetical protein